MRFDKVCEIHHLGGPIKSQTKLPKFVPIFIQKYQGPNIVTEIANKYVKHLQQIKKIERGSFFKFHILLQFSHFLLKCHDLLITAPPESNLAS